MTSRREWTTFDGDKALYGRGRVYSEGVSNQVNTQPCDVSEFAACDDGVQVAICASSLRPQLFEVQIMDMSVE